MAYEFIVPARNEVDHIGRVVESMRKELGETIRIIVVDNGSSDNTAYVARLAGADEVISETRIGKGYAVIAGAHAAKGNRVFVCDADISGMDWNIALRMISLDQGQRLTLTRAHLKRSPESSPVTTLLVIPMLKALGHCGICEPLGGVFSVERSLLLESHLPGGWGFDVGLTLHCLERGVPIVEVPVSEVTHRIRQLSEYSDMAEQVACTIAQRFGASKWDHQNCTLCSGCQES